MKEEFHIDMDSEDEREMFADEFAKLRGMVIITVKENKDGVSNPQRRLYFGVYVRAYQNYFRAQGQSFSKALCHRLLKRRFLRTDIFDKRTGEVIGEDIGSIADGGDVDRKEMGAYLDQVHDFLVNDLGMGLPRITRMGQRVNVERVMPRMLPAGGVR